MLERALTSLVALPLALTLLLLVTILVLRLLIPREPEGLKEDRYEAGNPPSGRARKPLGMQYFGFLIMFLGLEPILILSFFVFVGATLELSLFAYAVLMAVCVPPLVYVYKLARNAAMWRW